LILVPLTAISRNLILQHLPTYSIPTRTAVSGIIAAVLGFGKEDYQEHFTKPQAKIAIGIRNPVKKVRISENLINTEYNT